MHMNIHRKEPPCSCETCGRAFIRRDCLMRHIRARHRDVLEDILANAEKKRLQQQLLTAATESANENLTENIIWNELTLTESIKELLTLLVDEECLLEFGYPDAPVDKVKFDYVVCAFFIDIWYIFFCQNASNLSRLIIFVNSLVFNTYSTHLEY